MMFLYLYSFRFKPGCIPKTENLQSNFEGTVASMVARSPGQFKPEDEVAEGTVQANVGKHLAREASP